MLYEQFAELLIARDAEIAELKSDLALCESTLDNRTSCLEYAVDQVAKLASEAADLRAQLVEAQKP